MLPLDRLVAALLITLLLVVAACAPPRVVAEPEPEEPVADVPAFEPVTAEALVDDGDLASLREAVGQSLRWLRGRPAEQEFDYGIRSVTAAEKVAAFEEFLAFLQTDPASEALSAWVLERFDLVVTEQERPGRVLVTGYYEPVISGSRVRTERDTVPVYARPDDLVSLRLRDFREAWPQEQTFGRVVDDRLVPYFTREDIQDEGVLEDRGLEIAWVQSRVDLFVVEVQGSGAIDLGDGDEMRIGYAAANGHVYRAVGRLLIAEDIIPRERMTMQAIRDYLEANPEEIPRVLNYNPSYVFFRELDTPPVGALGVPVVGERSIATDLRLFPRGALGFLETTIPVQDEEGRVLPGPPLERFVLNHDTGGAIRGPHRVDFFWGRGEDATRLASLMQQEGRLLVMVPRGR